MPHLDLTDAELSTAATACRAMAYQEEKRAKAMVNPTTRGPIEFAARCYASLAEKLEAARKRSTSGTLVRKTETYAEKTVRAG